MADKSTEGEKTWVSLSDCVDDCFDWESERHRLIPISTGFDELDNILSGGIKPGLTVIGAISAIGKSTLMLQIAENISNSGEAPVLYFSLEMTADYISAKALSRQLFIQLNDEQIDSERGISADTLLQAGSEEDLKKKVSDSAGNWKGVDIFTQYENAKTEMKKRNENLYIIETWNTLDSEHPKRLTANQIPKTVEDFQKEKNKKPLVIVDYLQILSSGEGFQDERMEIDNMVQLFVEIALRLKVPVILISSLNRASYDGTVKLESFKESGAIEYSADTVLGLDFTAIKNDPRQKYSIEKLMTQTPREVSLTVLKQRYGAPGGQVALDYYSAFDYFCPAETKKTSASHSARGKTAPPVKSVGKPDKVTKEIKRKLEEIEKTATEVTE